MVRLVRQALTAACAAVVLAVSASGCTPDSPSPSPSSSSTQTSTTTSPSTTPTATPTPSPEDEAGLRAEEVLRAYLRAQTECLSDPQATELTCFDAVAIGTELINLRNALISAQSMQTRVEGGIAVDSLELRSVDLTHEPEASPPVVATVVFAVCADLSGYNVLDKDGTSIVPSDRPAVSPLEVSVYDYDYPDPAAWRVGYVVPAEDLECGG